MARVLASDLTRNRIAQIMNGAVGERNKSGLIREVAWIDCEGSTAKHTTYLVGQLFGRERWRLGHRGRHKIRSSLHRVPPTLLKAAEEPGGRSARTLTIAEPAWKVQYFSSVCGSAPDARHECGCDVGIKA